MTLLPFHIVAGLVAVATGYVALAALKGGTLHRRSGMIFFYAMLAMSSSGAVMAAMKLNRGNVMAGSLTFYMVSTAWLAVQPRVKSTAWMDRAALALGLGVCAAAIVFFIGALRSPSGTLDGYPAPLFLVFGTIIMLAAAGDVRMMLAGGLHGAPRIARHLWRMCFALFIAAGSFFGVTKRPIALLRGLLGILGLAGTFPQALRLPGLFIIPTVLPLIAMAYWLWRVRRSATPRMRGARPARLRHLSIALPARRS